MYNSAFYRLWFSLQHTNSCQYEITFTRSYKTEIGTKAAISGLFVKTCFPYNKFKQNYDNGGNKFFVMMLLITR